MSGGAGDLREGATRGLPSWAEGERAGMWPSKTGREWEGDMERTKVEAVSEKEGASGARSEIE